MCGATGLVYIVDQLDYEVHSKYDLVVRATDSVSGVYAEVPVRINVEDANDSPPEFSLNEYNISISEATPFGTTLLTVIAHDQDSGECGLALFNQRTLMNYRFRPLVPNEHLT